MIFCSCFAAAYSPLGVVGEKWINGTGPSWGQLIAFYLPIECIVINNSWTSESQFYP
jgi:hypothetical protein